MYESKSDPPLTRGRFAKRMALHLVVAIAVTAATLALGMWGYHRYEKLPPIDGFVNSAMLLGGMGPIDLPKTPGGKIFEGVYALFAGLVFVAAAGLVVAPVLHRLLHRFHFDDE